MVAAPQERTDLFDPVQVGEYRLANRIVMAPLTRSRATEGGEATPLMAEYYAQRATAGLIVAEGTNISPQGRGYAFTPGIYSASQVAAWRPVTQAIHDKGGRVFVQLWHVGRISHPSLQPNGELPVAPSAICPKGTSFTETGFQPCVTPRALKSEEIGGIVAQYGQAARNAVAAGFDGVEIHAANGYLIEQFLRDSTNRRTDAYGGTRQKRARFLLEVVEAVVKACGAKRVGIRLSPVSPVNDADLDSDPMATYRYVVEQLNAFNIAYLHVIEGVTQGTREVPNGFDMQVLRRDFNGIYIANNGYDLQLALAARRSLSADLVAFGRLYIANPDLVERLRIAAPLNTPDRSTFFGGGARGYTDYPALDRTTQLVSGADFPYFKRILRARQSALRVTIHEALLRSDQEQYLQIAGQVHDAEDESLADLLVDVNLAEITREIQELRDIDAAFRRIVMGTYGVCVRCGQAIERERLDAYPTAKRCIACQRHEEHLRTASPPSSL
jgi:N-ethylmaleimide reductase